MNLTELRAQYKGTRFYELIQHQLRRQSQERRTQGIQGTVLMLPESAQALAEGFIDRWNARAYEGEFWQRDTAEVFDEIIDDARTVLRPLGFATDDEAVFNLFNIVVFSYAYSAHDQPKMREYMGISLVAFPWKSALALLYPISAAIYVATSTPANPAMVVGYGVANLGYLLFAAGIWAGSFRILGLTKRWHVLAAAVAAFAVGTVLSNVGA